MAEAIAVELFLMTLTSLLPHLPKYRRSHVFYASLQTSRAIRLLLPPFVIGNTSARAQYLAVPVLSGTSAAIVHFDGTDRSLQVIVGAWKSFPVVALNQSWSQMRHHVEQMPQPELLVLSALVALQERGEMMQPVI
jgi:hypothetical protein